MAAFITKKKKEKKNETIRKNSKNREFLNEELYAI